MNTILPLLSRMQQRRSGQIAIFSSGAGFCAEPMNPIYSATKVALTAYGESLRYIMRDYNVFVSVVDPGAVRTPMTLVPYLQGMESSLASPEGMAKTLRAGLKRLHAHRLHHGAALGDRDSPRRYALHCQGLHLARPYPRVQGVEAVPHRVPPAD